MADMFQILGIDSDYDKRMSKWLWQLLASSKNDEEFLEAIANKLRTMPQIDAFTCGMFVNAFFIYRALLNNPELIFDQAQRFFKTYEKYKNKPK